MATDLRAKDGVAADERCGGLWRSGNIARYEDPALKHRLLTGEPHPASMVMDRAQHHGHDPTD
jgi:hypothetical protein